MKKYIQSISLNAVLLCHQWCNTLLKMQTGLLKYSQRKLTPCQLNNLFYFAGAILCAMYKAQRNEVTGVVWWRPLPAPGGLPWPAGECEGTQGGLCLQAALCSLPAEVRQRDYGLVKWSLQQRSVTPWVKCVKKFKKVTFLTQNVLWSETLKRRHTFM